MMRTHLKAAHRGERIMLTDSFLSIANAARQLLKNWRALLLLALVYAGLLASLYLFVSIREASAGQVAMTLALAIAAPALFFLLQTTSARQTNCPRFGVLLNDSLRNTWKVFLVSVPLIVLAALAFYLLTRVQTYLGVVDRAPQIQPAQVAEGQPLEWSIVGLTTVRYVLIGAVLPLVMIHFWIATVHQGIVATVKKARALFARAFSAQAVLIYMAGFVVFGLVPYVLLFWATASTNARLEVGLFVARLAGVFMLTLFGWVVTMNALANSASQTTSTLQVKANQ